ncbi:MAG: hypothetical protein AB7H96_18305 [Vicinamibacterales bacterium]
MALTDERLRALTRKRAVLATSLEAWLDQTADVTTRRDPAFQIHYVQTRDVDRLMGGIRRLVDQALARTVDAGAVAQRGATLEAAILAGCEVWEFFRGKLAQRLDGSLRTFLRVGDELAWQCYRPVRNLAHPGSDPVAKAPPLVYLNSTWSPFTVTRDRAFEVSAVPQAFLRNADFRSALSRLPFPVIAVPWYQTAYLPDAVSICHEVGHSVEADFGLTDQIAGRIATVVPDSAAREAWVARGSELFADFHGCLSVGPAYAWALANILLTDATGAVAAHPSYPPLAARMAFNAAVIEAMGFAAESAEFVRACEEAFPPGAAAADAESARAIGAAFVGTGGEPGITVGGARLAGAFGFTAAQQDEAAADAQDLVGGGEAASAEIRVLCAAAVLASRQPRFTAQDRLLATMRAACVDERRNAEAARPGSGDAGREAHLAGVGEALAGEMLGDLAVGLDG